MNKLQFSDAVYAHLFGMQPYQVNVIRQMVGTRAIPTERAIPYFIEVLKDFISRDEGRMQGFYAEFSNDYLRFRKVPYFKPHKRLLRANKEISIEPEKVQPQAQDKA